MLYLNKKLHIFGKIDFPLCWIQMMRLLYTSFLVNVYVSFSYGFNLGYIIRNGKNTQNNNDTKVILESQRITLSLTENISGFTLGWEWEMKR